MKEELLTQAAELFYKANCSSRNPNKKYRKQIEKLLLEYWKENQSSGENKIELRAGLLYTLLHQAIQTLP